MQASKKFYNKCSENSRSQIVFRTDIFRKLTLGASEILIISHFRVPQGFCIKPRLKVGVFGTRKWSVWLQGGRCEPGYPVLSRWPLNTSSNTLHDWTKYWSLNRTWPHLISVANISLGIYIYEFNLFCDNRDIVRLTKLNNYKLFHVLRSKISLCKTDLYEFRMVFTRGTEAF